MSVKQLRVLAIVASDRTYEPALARVMAPAAVEIDDDEHDAED